MEVATYEFETDYIDILPIGDLHLGSETSDFNKIIKALEQEKDAKIIFLGDLIDNAIANSLGDVYSQRDNPHETIQQVNALFNAFRERILGVVGGNHERRTWRKVGVDPIALLCEEKGIPYSDDLMVVDINLKQKGKKLRGSKNRINYKIACHHGSSGGRFPERSMRQHRYFFDVITGIDIYLAGHTHVPEMHKFSIFEYDSKNKKIRKKDVVDVTVPAWNDEKYAVQKLLAPTARGIFRIRLYTEKNHKVEVLAR
ncbi:DNA repair exonuclease [Marinitoga sp. 1135]|uniref:metallophosphoesterase n=1 Tax=Marinitoga sp. 1135 TaxID=1643333 RepID=UPI001586C405|nr:metallophosphoesterase [Marinitoga sp. 1135]NUU94838.1 DNA repair exonuclease [Marinitoga sp. 1135]